jgi:hypothetical protein
MLAMIIGSFAASSYAQQRLTRDQLVGTWTLVSCVNAKGGTPPQCRNPKGRLMHDPGGRFTLVIAAGDRPRLAEGVLRTQRSAEDYKSVAMGLDAVFGTWSFNEADQTYTGHAEAAFFPQVEGTDTKFSLVVTGDDLKFINPAGAFAIWRRTR